MTMNRNGGQWPATRRRRCLMCREELEPGERVAVFVAAGVPMHGRQVYMGRAHMDCATAVRAPVTVLVEDGEVGR